jgi:hypothetical protein
MYDTFQVAEVHDGFREALVWWLPSALSKGAQRRPY